ncbi:cell death activator CIDE-B [Erpetoichthys calabaricus]|uniref:Cell death inducing DFFA like effector b n=1 Tax=Erpetoichthys calabaricus TaxID=27687 RepID=A0A8C4SJZ5_ERPCA|nr:cell death activator CIDE-B [Erpetoichthys calabaricus]
MEAAAGKDFTSRLSASSLIKSVSSVGTELTRRVWAPSPPPQRPFRVCNHDRTLKKGLTAGTLQELLEKAVDALLLCTAVSLVLEEDGTEVDSENFFQTLSDGTTFVALEYGQTWKPSRGGVLSYSLTQKPRNTKDIARITFDLYKLNPHDLFGSLNVKATFYGLYSMSLDLKCLGPKKVLRELLRCSSSLMYALGHLLLTSATYIRRIIEGADRWHTTAPATENWY